MTVQYNGLLKILCRKYKGVYTKERIAKIIEQDGANHLDENIKYIGFGMWEVQKGE